MNLFGQQDNHFDDEETNFYENCFDGYDADSFYNLENHPDVISQSSNNKISANFDQIFSSKLVENTQQKQGKRIIQKDTKNSFYQLSKQKKKSLTQIVYGPNDRKSNIGLTPKAILFKEDFYSIFLNNIKGKRIIPKEKVIEIHNSICEEAGVRKMLRNEYRNINNYFQNFCEYRVQIIKSILNNKEKLSALIDLPSIIQRAQYVVECRKKRYNQ